MPPATDKNHEPDELNCVRILALCQEEPQCPSIVPGAVSPTPGDNHTKHETGMKYLALFVCRDNITSGHFIWRKVLEFSS